MLYELIIIGSTPFWVMTTLIVLISLMIIDEFESCGASIIQSIYVAALILLSNINLNLSKYWWSPFPYLLIGALWFLFLMTHKLKNLKRWVDKQPDPEKTMALIQKGDYGIPSKWRYVYQTEPSWAKFSDRVLLWPLSMIKFMTGDMLRAAYDTISDLLVAYRNKILGIGTK